MLEVGEYVALALAAVEVVLIVFLVLRKITKAPFITASVAIVFMAAFFWSGSRVTEVTFGSFGTIKTAVNLATQYAEDIKNIKADVERQKQVIDAVATAAHATDRTITELTEKNIKAGEQLRQVTEQLEQAQRLTHELQQQQEYSNVARYNVFGPLGLARAPLAEHSPLNNILGSYLHEVPNDIFWDCTPEAVKAYTEAIKFESKFPFAYYYRAGCEKADNTGDWQHDVDTARTILGITTQIPGHHANHDEVLKWIDAGYLGQR